MTPARPDPEALLRLAEQERSGRLKVFLGAAPGVGKTCEMLDDALGQARAGVDVVVGIVETHGRVETEARLRPLPMLPRKEVAHRGHTLLEMDIDAILERRPALVLVDELAHANAPGSRHDKRWQDVEEILAAGIDVWSTLNIQHLESLNDVVASFTHVRVRETVPDRLLDRAEIEVVDTPPDELIERLRAGKVYVPHEGARAAPLLSRSNLSALRELVLRRAAQAVDAQMLDAVRAQALAGTWATADRVLVAVGSHDAASDVVRAGRRLADACARRGRRCISKRRASARRPMPAWPKRCTSPRNWAGRYWPCRPPVWLKVWPRPLPIPARRCWWWGRHARAALPGSAA
jgi:two-component system sensor histidine kinase KdpD